MQVYEKAARDIVKGILEGYNGTILAYGQVSVMAPANSGKKECTDNLGMFITLG